MMSRIKAIALALILCFILPMSPKDAIAQSAADIDDPILQRWTVTLDWIELELDGDEAAAANFNRYSSRLGTLIEEVEQIKAVVSDELEAPRQELDALGAPPEDGEPGEASEISAQREAINEQIAVLTQQEKQAELLIVRAEQLLERLGETRGQRLQSRLLTRTSALYTHAFWRTVITEATQLMEGLAHDARALLQGQRKTEWTGWLVLALALIFALAALPFSRWLTRQYGRQPQANESSYAQRTLSAFAEGVAGGLLPAAIIGGIGFTLVNQGLVGDQAVTLVKAVSVSLVLAVMTSAPIKAALVPHAPNWRLLQVDSAVAARLTRRLQWLIAFCAMILALYIASEPYRPYGAELDLVGRLVVALVVGLVLLGILDRRFWRAGAPQKVEDQPSPLLGALRRILLAIVATALALAVFGYVDLSAFLVSRIAFTVLTVGALLLIRRLLHELLDRLIRAWRDVTSVEGRSSKSSLGVWLGAVLDLLLIGPVLLLLATAWGLPQTTFYLWSRRLLDGVIIGELTFSPGRLLLAILVFTVVFVATRLLRRILYYRVLPETRMDSGLRHSLYVGTGYAGLALAVILAVVTLGVGWSNLALVFGALSVGIGLGLQGVVSNFMSGLILLAQRPVRVGDWIEVGEHEGIVRNVMGVSTEIETFDKASIIIPNGDLVSNSVVNWTHTDRTVRVIINVGIAYGSDVNQFQALLLECASKHNEVLQTPKPYALFVDFGESALLFELRVFVGDAERYHIVSSQLRFLIEKACRQAEIEIPFPQRHVHIDSLPTSRTAPSTGHDTPHAADPPRQQPPANRDSAESGDDAD
ncbi:MAG: mechanosensitive ion channel family protein [Granulosicoccus sp.]|nr:mechanosensitive ion channel family protein [Granulosicoccus sp.]